MVTFVAVLCWEQGECIRQLSVPAKGGSQELLAEASLCVEYAL